MADNSKPIRVWTQEGLRRVIALNRSYNSQAREFIHREVEARRAAADLLKRPPKPDAEPANDAPVAVEVPAS